MVKYIKRSLGLLLCVSILLGTNLITFAKSSQPESGFNTEFYENENQQENMQNPYAKAPAKPVYKINITGYRINPENDHVEVYVKVWGYGREMVTFDGKRVFAISMPPIYEGGMQVGVSYTYDCGVKPAPGNYDFVVTFTDYGFPYDKHTASKVIPIS